MVSNKVLWILSGSIGLVFLILIISLAIMDKIKIGTMIVFIMIVVLLTFIIDMAFWFIRKGSKINVEKDGKLIKVINLETARNLSKNMIMSEQYSEYERECRYEDVWHMGNSKTPIYIKLIKGEFDGNLIGILINMQDSDRRGIKEYKESEINDEKILLDMERRANFLSLSPRETPSQEEEVIERPGGEVVRRMRTIEKDLSIKDVEGELK